MALHYAHSKPSLSDPRMPNATDLERLSHGPRLLVGLGEWMGLNMTGIRWISKILWMWHRTSNSGCASQTGGLHLTGSWYHPPIPTTSGRWTLLYFSHGEREATHWQIGQVNFCLNQQMSYISGGYWVAFSKCDKKGNYPICFTLWKCVSKHIDRPPNETQRRDRSAQTCFTICTIIRFTNTRNKQQQ